MSLEEKKVSNLPVVKPLLVSVQGKVTRTRRYEKSWYTTIICPAKDVYSRPSIVEIRSKQKFSETDDEVKVQAELGGYEGKSYPVVDKETGERRTLIPVTMFLDLIE